MKPKRVPFPPLELLREYFFYESKTGELRWKKSKPPRGYEGDLAGCYSPDGYFRVRFAGNLYLNHRLIWFLKTGEDPGDREVDHINLNRSDNRWTNLRLASPSSNMHNMRLLKRNKSGAKGVCWCKTMNKWRAYATVNYKQYRFGYFSTIKEAEAAAVEGRKALHKQFADHG